MGYYEDARRLALESLSDDDFKIKMLDRFKALDRFEQVNEILEDVIKYSGLPYDVIFSKSQKRDASVARHVFFFTALKTTSLTDTDLSLKYGFRERTSLINSVRRMQGFIDINDTILYIYKPFIAKYNLNKYKSN